MPEAIRAAVVNSGLDHSSRTVKHKAARAITLVPAGEQASLWEIAMKLAKQDNGMKAIISQLGP